MKSRVVWMLLLVSAMATNAWSRELQPAPALTPAETSASDMADDPAVNAVRPGRLTTLAAPRPVPPTPPVSKYWIGVLCRPVDAMLLAHVELPQGQGVMVQDVLPDGPGAAAGLQRYDILLAADEKPLAEVADLIAAVDASEGKSLTLDVFRAGKRQAVKVRPAERPTPSETLAESGPRVAPPALPFDIDMAFDQEQVGRLMDRIQEQLRALEGQNRTPFRLHMLRPGLIVPGHPEQVEQAMSRAVVISKSSDGKLTIRVERDGDQPAKVTVERDGQTYEATGDNLDDLPEELRPPVQKLLDNEMDVHILKESSSTGPLDGLRPRLQFQVAPRFWDGAAEGEGRMTSLERGFSDLETRMKERLQRMERQMEQLRRRFESASETPKDAAPAE